MKRALLFIAVCLGAFSGSQAQVTSITVEEFYTDNGSVEDYPAGHTTYRIYANTQNANDRVTTVSGNDDNPLSLSVSGSGIWNSPIAGGVLGDASPCILFDSPATAIAEYDSYLTIGVACNDDASANPIYKAEDSSQPWQNQAFATAPYGSGEFVVNTPVGATWFVLPDNANSQAGSDLKVLIAQITTDGEICGVFNLQVFPNYSGPGSSSVNSSFEFSSTTGCVAGCTEPSAINFNATATYDNGLCLLPCDIALDTSAVVPGCPGANAGSISVTASGAQAFYDYFLNGASQGLSSNGTNIFENLSAGSYTVTVRDTRYDNVLANPGGLTCEATQVVSVSPVFLTSSVGTAIACAGENNGSVATNAANYGGGTGTLSFALFSSNGNPVLDGNNDPVVLSSPNYSGLTGGSYYFEVTDGGNCSAQGSNFTIASPLAINMEASSTGVGECFNSTDVTKIVSWFGGTGDVDFSLVNDGTYLLDGGPSTIILDNLSVGDVTLYAQDENGCTAEYTFTVTGGPAIVVNVDVVNPSCNGDNDGSVTVSSTGGTGAILYSFDGGALSANNSVTGLGNASIVMIAEDAIGCQFTQTIEVVEPEVLGGLVTVGGISCNGEVDGSIGVEATGGTFPIASYTLNGTITSEEPTALFTGLAAGNYTVSIEDANGCTFESTTPSVIVEPAVLSINGLSANPIDVDPGGSSTYTVTGGTAPYSYLWNGPGGFTSTDQNLTGLTDATDVGAYTLTVTDANGCEVSQSITVTGIDELNRNYAISLYPNPNNGQFVLSMEGLAGEMMSYTILDNSGRVVVSKDLGNVRSTRTESIDMAGAAAGIYQVRLAVGAETHSMRFVKQ